MTTPFMIRQAVRALKGGGVIAYPTEAVYGLGCDPMNAEAVSRLLGMKQREMAKGLILVAADLQQLEPFLVPLSQTQLNTLQASWPGPNTWIVPARAEVPFWIRGRHEGLTVRVSAHPLIQSLCTAFGGPIISTSANRSGQHPALNVLQVRRYFDAQLDVVLSGELGGASRPTQIRDLQSGDILRNA